MGAVTSHAFSSLMHFSRRDCIVFPAENAFKIFSQLQAQHPTVQPAAAAPPGSTTKAVRSSRSLTDSCLRGWLSLRDLSFGAAKFATLGTFCNFLAGSCSAESKPILQVSMRFHFSCSTRFAHFCTAPSSIFKAQKLITVKISNYFS